MGEMPLGTSINVRLDENTETRLEAVSKRFGVKSSMLIRNAVRAFLETMEGSDTLVLQAQNAAEPHLAESSDTKPQTDIQPSVKKVSYTKKRPKSPDVSS